MVQSLRNDKGIEFWEKDFEKLCKNRDIVRHYTNLSTLQKNRVVKRMTKTLLEKM